ncbi:hypothetical protein BpHYR1_022259 [Brachionus plicatilis]|uniref:Uncharacterized protein n=1 Tax=Brachionus plicatilis TaxID=10195 RepID=A0A3M7Q7W4_BRAPC|nr:hypothetical protein BpHYR1_022259 [Brachionus plicatilis]
MAVFFGIFYRIPNSINFFLTNTLSNDNLDQCLRTANSEMFWNGEECESAFGFGSKCSNDEQCQIIIQYTFCIENTCKDETSLNIE